MKSTRKFHHVIATLLSFFLAIAIYGCENATDPDEEKKDGWQIQTDHMPVALNAVHFVDENTGWTVGIRGEILKTNDGGETWKRFDIHAFTILSAVHFNDGNTGWVVGRELGRPGDPVNQSVLLKTNDGGITWKAQFQEKNRILNSIHFINNHVGWVVGNRLEDNLITKSFILKTTNAGE